MPAGAREEHARIEIDRQLEAAGWPVAPAGARLHHNRNTPLTLCEECNPSVTFVAHPSLPLCDCQHETIINIEASLAVA